MAYAGLSPPDRRLAAPVGSILAPHARRPATGRNRLADAPRGARGPAAQADIAHDLNNLLAVILNANEALTAELRADGTARDLAQLSIDAAERAADLVRGLLVAASSRDERAPACDPVQVARSVIRLLGRSLPEGVHVDVQTGEGDLSCAADRQDLERALMNLCVNAGHAMPQGGQLTISVRAVRGEMALTVSDTGCGMPAHVLARATEAFFTTRRGRGGTGLGLCGVRDFASRNGGRFELRSEEGRGTVAALYLPRA